MRLDIAARSVPGSVHPYEDRTLIDRNEGLFAVADGVTISSQGSGGAAAELAISLLRRKFQGDIVESIMEVHEEILEAKRRGDGTIGETTLTAAHIKRTHLEIANVGDSPAFLIRAGTARTLTQSDKSEYGYITQVIGYPETIKVHLNSLDLENGDCTIVASDGVGHVLDSPYLPLIVSKHPDATDLADEIINQARQTTSAYDDDKSVIVLYVLSAE